MPWTFNNFPEEMKKLPPAVRIKAIQIANTLVLELGYDEARAITTAIRRALRWAQGGV